MIKLILILLLLIVNVQTSECDEPVLCDFDSEEEIAETNQKKSDYLEESKYYKNANNTTMSLKWLEDLEELEALDNINENAESSDSEEVYVTVNKPQPKSKNYTAISANDTYKKKKKHRKHFKKEFDSEVSEFEIRTEEMAVKEILDYKKEFGTEKWKVRWNDDHDDTWESRSSFIVDGKICLVFQEFEAKRTNNKYYGVSWDKAHNKWSAYVWHRKKYHIGYYLTEIEAAKAVNNLCRELQISIKNPFFFEENTKSSNSEKVDSFTANNNFNKIVMNPGSKVKKLHLDTNDYNVTFVNDKNKKDKSHLRNFKKIFDSEESEAEIRTQTKQKTPVDSNKSTPRLLHRTKQKINDAGGVYDTEVTKQFSYKNNQTYTRDEIDSDTTTINQMTAQIAMLEKSNAVKREILQKIKTEKKPKLQSCLQKKKLLGDDHQNCESNKLQVSFADKTTDKRGRNIDYDSNVKKVLNRINQVLKPNPWNQLDQNRQAIYSKRKRTPICEYCDQLTCEPYLLKSKSTDLKLCDACYRSEKKHGKLIPRHLRRPEYPVSDNICEYCQRLNTGKYLLKNKTSEFKICRNCYRAEKKRDLLVPLNKRARGIIKLKCNHQDGKIDSLDTEDKMKVKTENENKNKKRIKLQEKFMILD